MTTLNSDGANLKGEAFADRLREICRELPPIKALDDLKYRRILIPGIIGGEIQFTLLTLLGHALRMRGAEVVGLCCDAFLPACTLRKIDHYESACHRWCYKNVGSYMEAARFPYRWYSEFVSEEEKAQFLQEAGKVSGTTLEEYEWQGIFLGLQVKRSIESFFKVGQYDSSCPEMVAKGREMLAAAMCMVTVGHRVIDEYNIDKVFMEDGMKVDWGVIREVARSRGIPVDVLLGSSRGATIMAEHDSDQGRSDPVPLWAKWKELPLTESQEKELDEYYLARASKPYEDQDWRAWSLLDDEREVLERIGIPAERTGMIFSMYPNLSFDAGVTTIKPTYETAAEWVKETIRFFEKHPDHQLIVKIHPAEGYREVQDPMDRYLAEHCGVLPENVHVIPHDTELSAHDVMKISDIVMVYTSTVGIEAAYCGKAIINVGGGWHAGRGLSMDVDNPTDYYELLDKICAGRLVPETSHELGRRYAYAVFFRSAMPLHFFRSSYPNMNQLCLAGLADLQPGMDRTVDAICRGVLCDHMFVLEE